MALRDLGLLYQQTGLYVGQDEIDDYINVTVANPSVSLSWFGTVSGGTSPATGRALVLTGQYADWPRNPTYSIQGVSGGTFGGTFQVNWLDQFGSQVQETVVIASAVNGGTKYGTAIVQKFISGTFTSQGSSGGSAGTAQIGFGTVGTSNYFGLQTKIAGTGDVMNISWINNGTPTLLNLGTNQGSLVDATRHAFRGTSGVALTDRYLVSVKTTFNTASKGQLYKNFQ